MEFYDEWSAWQQFDLSHRWRLSFFILETSGRGLLRLEPMHASVMSASKQVLEEPLWPPQRKTYTRRATQHQQQGAPGSSNAGATQISAAEAQHMQLDIDVEFLPQELEEDEDLDVLEDLQLEDLLDRAQTLSSTTHSHREQLAPSSPFVAPLSAQEERLHEGQLAATPDKSTAADAQPYPVTITGAQGSEEPTRRVAAATRDPQQRDTEMTHMAIGAAASSVALASESNTPIPGFRGTVGKSAASIKVDGGRISFYANKSNFEAVCDNKLHGKCVLTRTANGRKSKGRAGVRGGRPVPFLALWLSRCKCATKAEHMDRDANNFSHKERDDMRKLLSVLPEAQDLLDHERQREDDETSEPEDLAGLWP
eukprot:6492721-Amphidinium_carterae.4